MYDPKAEYKWNDYWREHGMFAFNRDDEAKPLFVIDPPPPFTTGDLHMGQAYWVIYIDSIARYKRMKGFNVLYPVGWDTQGYPIEVMVEKKYGKGLPRADFYKRCTEMAEANISSMKAQMLMFGASFDPSLEYITMSEQYRRKVQLSMLEMYEKGFVYRAEHPVEWCPYCVSSISREEAEDKEEQTQLNYVNFALKDSGETIEIATTRPELLHACVAVAVNPSDDRYKALIGKKVEVPIYGREVKIIGDESVEKDFGTGAEMVCTFGDKQDILLYYKHKLQLINSLTEDGRLRNAGKYDGLTIKEAKKTVTERLKEMGVLKKQESLVHTIKVHDRCGTRSEFISAMQWFIKTKEHSERIKEQARQVSWIPEHAAQKLYDWSNFIEWDWNISRNRVFGTPIPFWYCEDCGAIIAPERSALPVDPALAKAPADKCPKCGSAKLKGETDTLDCWVDSSITPMVVAGWPDDMELYKRAYPTSMRIQGTDIIRTWAFYTIFRTWALTGNKPFETMLTHGMILDPVGKEMHKSWGNGISPNELAEKYSIDSVRLWTALSGGPGKDKPFSFEEIEHAKSFIVKLYNSALFVKNAMGDVKVPAEEPHTHFNIFDLWVLNRLNSVAGEATKAYDRLDLYGAMTAVTNFYWHEFCDHYIEAVKHRIYAEGNDGSKKAALFTLMHVLSSSLRMLAPVIPHAAEEINSMFSQESVFLEPFPAYAEKPNPADYIINGLVFKSSVVEMDYEDAGAIANDIVDDVRKAKASRKIALNKPITLININVPDAYYNTVLSAAKDIKEICKAGDVKIERSKDYSVSIQV